MTSSDVFSDEFYANSWPRRLRRAVALGGRYYLWSLPRYAAHRWSLGLSPFDFEAAVNPIWELFDRKQRVTHAPDGYEEALNGLRSIGMRLTLPPSRVAAVLNCWACVSDLPGDVIECGSYRGATALLIALLSKRLGRPRKVFLLDTFNGSPSSTKFDTLRKKREYVLPAQYCDALRRHAASLDLEGQIDLHPGEFSKTFEALEATSLQFAFAHIDANLYESTWDACNFVIPRIVDGGAVVFDDYHGPCDLGARLAIDRYLFGRLPRPRRLAGSSAWLKVSAAHCAERGDACA